MTFTAKFKRNPSGGGDVCPLPPGSHQAVLMEVNDCQVPVWSQGMITESMQEGLEFVWKTDNGQMVTKQVSKSAHENSNLYKFLSGLAPGEIARAIQSDESLAALIQDCIGRHCVLQVGVTQKGKNRLSSVILLPGQVKEKKPVQKAECEQDLIPF